MFWNQERVLQFSKRARTVGVGCKIQIPCENKGKEKSEDDGREKNATREKKDRHNLLFEASVGII